MADLAAPLREAAVRILAGEEVVIVLPPDPDGGVPAWMGETCDHIIETCPLKAPNARRCRGLVDPDGTDICGWCRRVWKARQARAEGRAGTTRKCRSRSKYGRCGRPGQHNGPHAVPIGDGVWYGYERGARPLGYGHFDGDDFCYCGRQASHNKVETNR